MRLTSKQKKILDVVIQKSPISAVEIFDTLEHVVGQKRRSRLNSFRKILGRMVNQHVMSKRPDGLYVPLSDDQIFRCKKTEVILNDLRRIRQDGKPFSLTTLLGYESFHYWTTALVKFQQTTGSPNLSIYEPLDFDTDKLELLMMLMEVDLEAMVRSHLIFCQTHQKTLQQTVHQILCEKMSHYKISRKKLMAEIQASASHSSPLVVIKQMLEPAGMLSPNDLSKILQSFQTSFLQNYVQQKLEHATFEKGESSLAKRFPSLFSGQWKWDLLYTKMIQKMVQFAKSQKIYQSQEEWLAKQKNESKQRFQQTQVNDPYAVLGLRRGTSIEEVKTAFRQLSKQHHPDSGGSAKEFQNILHAYRQLMEKK